MCLGSWWLKRKTSDWTGGVKWQCIPNCHLFELALSCAVPSRPANEICRQAAEHRPACLSCTASLVKRGRRLFASTLLQTIHICTSSRSHWLLYDCIPYAAYRFSSLLAPCQFTFGANSSQRVTAVEKTRRAKKNTQTPNHSIASPSIADGFGERPEQPPSQGALFRKKSMRLFTRLFSVCDFFKSEQSYFTSQNNSYFIFNYFTWNKSGME